MDFNAEELDTTTALILNPRHRNIISHPLTTPTTISIMANPLVRRLQAVLDSVDKKASYAVYSKAQKYTPRLKPFLVALEWSCNGLVWLASTIILIVSNSEQTSMVPKLLIGLIVDVMYVATIKALARRRRPTYAYQRDQMIVSSVDKHSFPSGHCSRSAYVALFTRHYFGQSSPFFTFIVNLWAMNVCASRVLLGRHHIFDCLAGIGLGWLNYTIQYHTFVPVNFLGMLLIRSLFGAKAFNDPNDMDGTDALSS